MIRTYAQIMHSRKVNGQVREIELVQTELRNTLWPIMQSCMENGNQICLINKRPYKVSINETLEFRGSTDHVMALTGGDFCPLTIKDKSVAADFKPQGIAQVQTQRMTEIQLMKEREPPYDPKKYVGILQNGFEWVFHYYFRRGDGSIWNRFHTPTANVSECENEQTYRNDCEITARYIEDALLNTDRIIEDLTTSSVLLNRIEELGDGIDEDYNGDAEEDAEDYDDPTLRHKTHKLFLQHCIVHETATTYKIGMEIFK